MIDVSINHLNIIDCSSSSNDIFDNVYTMAAIDLINNDDVNKKVYRHLKHFINNIQITSDKNLITSIIFDSRNSKVKKLNIKGYVRKY